MNVIMKKNTTRWGILIFPVIALNACAYEGDFGRLEQSKLKNKYNNVVGSIQRETGLLSDRAAYHIPYTEDERLIRRIYTHFKRSLRRSRKFHDPSAPVTFTDHKSPKSLYDHLSRNMSADIKYVKRAQRLYPIIIQQDLQRFEVVSATYDVS